MRRPRGPARPAPRPGRRSGGASRSRPTGRRRCWPGRTRRPRRGRSVRNPSSSSSSSDDAEDPALGQQPGLGQVEQPGEQLAARQVAGRAEQDDDVRVGRGDQAGVDVVRIARSHAPTSVQVRGFLRVSPAGPADDRSLSGPVRRPTSGRDPAGTLPPRLRGRARQGEPCTTSTPRSSRSRRPRGSPTTATRRSATASTCWPANVDSARLNAIGEAGLRRHRAPVAAQPAAGHRVAPHPPRDRRRRCPTCRSSWSASPAPAPPRSATSSAADPANRSLRQWEAHDSVPPPTTEGYWTDPRYLAAQGGREPARPHQPPVQGDPPRRARGRGRVRHPAQPALRQHLDRRTCSTSTATSTGCSPPTSPTPTTTTARSSRCSARSARARGS